MDRLRRRIILTGKRLDKGQLTLDSLHSFSNDYLFFDPIELMKEVDWTQYESNTACINTIYKKLFDGFVIENKTLVCYWPATNFPDSYWDDCVDAAKKAGILVEVNSFIEEMNQSDELLIQFQSLWKELLVEMIQSVSEDIILNEKLEEIARLENEDYSITIFAQHEIDRINYFYVSSVQEVFEFVPQYEFEQTSKLHHTHLFETFEALLQAVQSEFDLATLQVEFLNKRLEKIYFNSLLNKNIDLNLIQNWMASYSMN